MDTLVSPTAVTPGIVTAPSYSANNGPAWSAFGPSEASLLVAADVHRNSVAGNTDENFTRVKIDQRTDFGTKLVHDQITFSELRSMIAEQNARYNVIVASMGDLKYGVASALSAQETAALRSRLDEANQKNLISELLSAVKALIPAPAATK